MNGIDPYVMAAMNRAKKTDSHISMGKGTCLSYEPSDSLEMFALEFFSHGIQLLIYVKMLLKS